MAEKIEFPWELEDPDDEKEQKQEEVKVDYKLLAFETIKKHKLYLGVLCAIILLYAFSNLNKTKTAPVKRARKVSMVLLPNIPIPKGEIIHQHVIREYKISTTSLTTKQKREIISAEELTKLQGMLYAKKNLSTKNPLLWSDVHFKVSRNTQHTQPQKLKIIYSEETQP